jgi:hypothetical protein
MQNGNEQLIKRTVDYFRNYLMDESFIKNENYITSKWDVNNCVLIIYKRCTMKRSLGP